MTGTIRGQSRVIVLACAIAMITPSNAQKLDKLTVAGWGPPISEITNLLAEPDKHFFKSRGIELTFMAGKGGGSAVKNMLTGKADVAFTDPASFYHALDKGEDLVAIYNIYPQNVFNVVSPKSRNITKPRDLKGKKVGVYSLSSGTRQNLQFLLHQVGLSEKDISVRVTGLLNFAPVIQGQVDATAATDTGLYVGKLKGLKEVNIIEVRDYLNVPSDMFVIRAEMYKTKKKLLRRFLAAYRDSAAWMIKHPKEAAKIAVKRAINGRNEKINLEIIKLRNLSTVSITTREKGLGHFDMDVLQQGADAFLKLGLIKKQINIARVIKSDLIPN